MLIAGVDEAGRGCVIGPLVITGYLIKEKNLLLLKALGVKDSKKLSSKKRENLAIKIMQISENCKTINLFPDQIDKVVESNRKFHTRQNKRI